MTFKKNISNLFLILALLLIEPVAFSAEEQVPGIVDDSVRDISIVVGTGVVGAILGLSTLSFADNPSEHWKNVSVGGAIGIVIGVGIVLVGQATKSSTSFATSQVPLNPEKSVTLSRHEFTEYKIAKDYLKTTDLGYSFSF